MEASSYTENYTHTGCSKLPVLVALVEYQKYSGSTLEIKSHSKKFYFWQAEAICSAGNRIGWLWEYNLRQISSTSSFPLKGSTELTWSPLSRWAESLKEFSKSTLQIYREKLYFLQVKKFAVQATELDDYENAIWGRSSSTSSFPLKGPNMVTIIALSGGESERVHSASP